MNQRQVVLDTETTGLDVKLGHRVIEIGAVELVSRRLSGQRFHCYLNPEREIDPGAREVHGIDAEFLADKPRFRELAGEFVNFVAGAELIIHNAPFDVSFLNQELALAGAGTLAEHCGQVTDTLALARELHPGRRNSLDALCERYGVDNSKRTLHGALLDAEILAEVYLAMTRGQDSLAIDFAPRHVASAAAAASSGPLLVVRADAAELAAHEAYLDEMERETKQAALWRSVAPREI